jgi:hypothetical protein
VLSFAQAVEKAQQRISAMATAKKLGVRYGKYTVADVYHYNWEHLSNVIEAHISNLRKKLMIGSTQQAAEALRAAAILDCGFRNLRVKTGLHHASNALNYGAGVGPRKDLGIPTDDLLKLDAEQ